MVNSAKIEYMKKPALIVSFVILLVVLGLWFFRTTDTVETIILPTNTEEITELTDAEYGIHFHVPQSWGTATEIPGIAICPEEDTYRTPETLSVIDKELNFPDVDLPNTDSFIRRGIKLHTLDPQNLNACGDEFLLMLANNEIIPEQFSSFKLISVKINTLLGVYNPNASRLNTEGRVQYTLFNPEGKTTVVIQPYLSFIPYYGSQELVEIEDVFGGNMELYLEKGVTAEPIRMYMNDLKELTESLIVLE